MSVWLPLNKPGPSQGFFLLKCSYSCSVVRLWVCVTHIEMLLTTTDAAWKKLNRIESVFLVSIWSSAAPQHSLLELPFSLWNIRSWQSEPFPMGGAACCPFATTARCDFSFCLSSSNDSLLPFLSFQGVIQDVKLIFAPNGYITQCPNLNRSKWSKRAPGVRPIFPSVL